MKRFLLLFILGVFQVSIQAQTLYKQDFENGFGDMILIDVDKNTPDPKVAAYTMAWNIRNVRDSKWAGSNSWFAPFAAADDWMITPVISGITSKTVISWDAFSGDPDYRDTYEVRVAENGGTKTSDFTKLLVKVNEENTETTKRGASLAAFAGKDIRIAFRNVSNDKYVIFVDNIEVTIPRDKDVALESAEIKKYGLVGSSHPIDFTFKNLGSNKVTSLKAQWSDGVVTKTEVFNNLQIEYGNSEKLTFVNKYEIVLPEREIIKIKILEVNGSADEDLSNNDDEIVVHGLVKESGPLKLLAEQGTGTWCGWCPRGSVFMQKMKKTYGGEFLGIAVHNNDPMTNQEYDNEYSLFPGFSGYPSFIVNRKEFIDPEDIEEYYNNEVRGSNSPAKLAFTTSYSGKTIKIDGDITFNTQFIDTVRLVAVVIEDNVKGTTSGYNQTNFYANNAHGVMGGFEKLPNPVPAAQMVYNEVARLIPFGFYGRDLNGGVDISAGDVIDFSFDIQIPDKYNINQVSVIIFATDEEGLFIGGDQSSSKAVSINELGEDSNIALFPNPTNGDSYLRLNIEKSQEVTISIYNQLGQEIASRSYGELSGEQVLPILSSQFKSGMYFVKLNVGNKQATQKLIVE